MKSKYNFELPVEDMQLFAQHKNRHVSNEERVFFETMEYKERHEPTYMYEMLILEEENDDQLFFIRMNEAEYKVGIKKMEHFDSLKDALGFDLFNIGHEKHIRLLDWLSQNNYSNVHYDRNNDLL